MINRRERGIKPFLTGSSVQIWTVVSSVQDRVSCSIHPSEYQAYREAVSRFESAELGDAGEDPELKNLLEAANACGDYREVRKYIAANSCRMHLMQLAEHSVNDLSGYLVRAPQLAQNRPLHVSL
jgi:hypothetical protein